MRAVLTKRIPVGRGLGGGSSDAAAALIGLLRLTGKRIEAARLTEIASGLGADVPFFLHGGRALGIGRGDEIYPLPDVAPPQRAGCFASRYCRAHTGRLPVAVAQAIDKAPETPLNYGGSVLCAGARRGAPSRTTLRLLFSPGIPDWLRSSGSCFGKELQGPRWRVAVRRCLEYSKTQRRRAELLGRFRRTRFLSARLFRGQSTAENWAGRILPERFQRVARNIKLDRR